MLGLQTLRADGEEEKEKGTASRASRVALRRACRDFYSWKIPGGQYYPNLLKPPSHYQGRTLRT